MTDDLVEAVARETRPDLYAEAADPLFVSTEVMREFYHHTISRHESLIRRVFTAIEARGLRIVPVEPTDRMIDAGHEKVICPAYVNAELCEAEDVWSAMLTAAPKHTALSPRDDRAVTEPGASTA